MAKSLFFIIAFTLLGLGLIVSPLFVNMNDLFVVGYITCSFLMVVISSVEIINLKAIAKTQQELIERQQRIIDSNSKNFIREQGGKCQPLRMITKKR